MGVEIAGGDLLRRGNELANGLENAVNQNRNQREDDDHGQAADDDKNDRDLLKLGLLDAFGDVGDNESGKLGRGAVADGIDDLGVHSQPRRHLVANLHEIVNVVLHVGDEGRVGVEIAEILAGNGQGTSFGVEESDGDNVAVAKQVVANAVELLDVS